MNQLATANTATGAATRPTTGSSTAAVFANTDAADWPFALRPLTPRLGAEISGVDLSHDLDSVTLAAIEV